jgi:hypothetical protein
LFAVLIGTLLVVLLSLVVSLLIAVVELPISIARGLFSSERRVEAICLWPNEIRMEWKTTREHAHEVAEAITRQLERGYEELEPANSTFLGFTDPPAGPD